MKMIDFSFINQKLSSGLKLRIDVGLSTCMPHSMEWLSEREDIFVIGFEPHPVSFESSKKCLSESGYSDRCYLIQAAISDVKELSKSVFYGLDGPETEYNIGTSSLKKPKGRFKNSVDEVYNVNVLPLSYVLDRINYDVIDYIKTDTQGSDLEVLKSLGSHIENVLRIQSECDSSSDYESANTEEELSNFLSNNNFAKYQPVFYYYQDENGNWMYQIIDYKYANTKLLSIYYYINDSYIPVTKETSEKNWGTWGDYLYELNVVQKFASFINNDSVVLDVGAQSGAFSITSKFYPDTKWHCFEPDSCNRSLLIDNLRLNDIKNVKISKEALSNTIGSQNLKICIRQRGLNTLGNNLVRFSSDECEESLVQVNTIDNLFLDTKIDLIKIDTEGSEYDIIRGGIETIKKYKPKILLEYCEENLNQCGHTLEDLNNLIDEIGYEIFWSDDHYNIFIQSKQ